MKVLTVTNLPIYLPADTANIPVGDPLSDLTVTIAAPGVFTAPGYNAPVNGDQVSVTFAAGGSMPAPLVAGTTYFVVGAGAGTFNVSATKAGAPITTTTTGASLTLHLLSGEKYGVTLPFKPGYTVVVENNSAGTLILQGAPDLNTTSYGNPQGPGAYVALATILAGGQQEVNLTFDWIRVSTAGSLFLLQN